MRCHRIPTGRGEDADSEVPSGGLGGAFQAMPHGGDGLWVDRDGVKAKGSMPVPRAGEAVASLKPARMSRICWVPTSNSQPFIFEHVSDGLPDPPLLATVTR